MEYNSYPHRVFTGQKFAITLKALILVDKSKYDKIVTTFTNENYIEVLTKNVKWIKNKNSDYMTTITYKVYNENFILPKITLALVKNGEIINFISINSPSIKYEKIAVNQKLFSKVIASSLEIYTAKTKQYTNDLLHTTIHITAKNSNLEDFYLEGYKDQGINSISQNNGIQNLYYYVMIPSYTKEIKFNYYNNVEKNFVNITIPIILDEELVSTQTELNPYNSSILVYKQITIGILLFICFLMYFFSKKDIYLIFLTILIAIFAYLFIPNKKILINKGIKVYILPSKHSTIFKILKHKDVIEIINKKNGFIKVLFSNKTIGWIKNNDN